jgi:hypothetical protein
VNTADDAVWATFGYATAQGQEYAELLDGSEQQAMYETFQNALENSQANLAARG